MKSYIHWYLLCGQCLLGWWYRHNQLGPYPQGIQCLLTGSLSSGELLFFLCSPFDMQQSLGKMNTITCHEVVHRLFPSNPKEVPLSNPKEGRFQIKQFSQTSGNKHNDPQSPVEGKVNSGTSKTHFAATSVLLCHSSAFPPGRH